VEKLEQLLAKHSKVLPETHNLMLDLKLELIKDYTGARNVIGQYLYYIKVQLLAHLPSNLDCKAFLTAPSVMPLSLVNYVEQRKGNTFVLLTPT
jgi:hypothetical protein